MTTHRAEILIVDAKESVLEQMASALCVLYDVALATDHAGALGLIEARRFDVVVADAHLPGGEEFEILAAVRRRWSAADTSVVVTAALASVPDAVRAIRLGASDYMANPPGADEVRLVVARALEHRERSARRAEERALDVEFREVLVAAQDRASRDYLVALMQRFHGHVTRAAEHARMTRENLHRLLRKHGVSSESFREAANAPAARPFARPDPA